MSVMSPPLRRLRAQLLIVAGLIGATLALVLTATGAVRDQELATVDARNTVRGATSPHPDIVIVRIDDVTFEALQTQWPFPRSMHATVIDRLRRAGAKAIAYDVQFTEPSERREDAALMDAVARARGRIVLATSEVNEFGESAILGSEATLRGLGGRSGNANLVADSDGAIRRTPHTLENMLAFPVAVAALAKRAAVSRDGFRADGTAWIDFPGPPGTIPSVPFSEVHAGTADPRRFRGKIVVVGPTAPSLQDNHPTAVGRDDPMAGVEIHAASIATMLDGVPLREAPGWLAALLVFALAFVVPAASVVLTRPRARGLVALALAVLVAAAYLGIAQLAFGAGLILPVFVVLAALSLGLVAVLGVEAVVATAERERIWGVLSRLLPRDVGETMLQARHMRDLCAEGATVTATVVICDLRGSTAFAERHGNRLWTPMNRYFDIMTKTVERHGGEVIQYQGDGILAAFGATTTQADHADRALAAVRDMAGPSLASFNAWLADHGYGDPMRMGIGVNSGSVMCGNVGSETRLQYTLLGDTVNTASRLEATTKELNRDVLISDRTFAMLKHEPPDLRYVDAMAMRGKHRMAVLWTLDPQPDASRDHRPSVPLPD